MHNKDHELLNNIDIKAGISGNDNEMITLIMLKMRTKSNFENGQARDL